MIINRRPEKHSDRIVTGVRIVHRVHRCGELCRRSAKKLPHKTLNAETHAAAIALTVRGKWVKNGKRKRERERMEC